MRRILALVVVTVVIVAGSVVPSQAGGRWQGGHANPGGHVGHGGWQGGHVRYGGWHHRWYGAGAFVGVPLFWGPRYVYGPPAYVVPPVYPSSAPVLVGPPQDYVQPQQSWYYCQDPAGYYPSVPECPGGWAPVAPQSQ